MCKSCIFQFNTNSPDRDRRTARIFSKDRRRSDRCGCRSPSWTAIQKIVGLSHLPNWPILTCFLTLRSPAMPTSKAWVESNTITLPVHATKSPFGLRGTRSVCRRAARQALNEACRGNLWCGFYILCLQMYHVLLKRRSLCGLTDAISSSVRLNR